MQQATLEDWLQHRNPPGSVEQYMNDKWSVASFWASLGSPVTSGIRADTSPLAVNCWEFSCANDISLLAVQYVYQRSLSVHPKSRLLCRSPSTSPSRRIMMIPLLLLLPYADRDRLHVGLLHARLSWSGVKKPRSMRGSGS